MTSVVRAISAFPRFVWDVAKIWYNGGIGDLAAGVTFWILITVPAAVLALVSSASFLGGILGASLETEIKFEVLQFVNEVFTSDAPSIQNTVNELFDQQNTGVFTIAAALTLYTISRGFAGMIRALDTVYDVEDGRTWYHTRFVGLILGLGTVLVVVPIVLLEIFLWSEYELPREAALRALASTTLLVGWASMLFHYGPSIRSKWRWDLPGATVAAVFWWALSVGYARYVGLVSGGSDSSDVLGIIGGFLLALTWIWIAAQVLLIGAAVNFVLGERLGLDRGRRRSVLNAAIFNATGELKKVVVSGSRQGDDDTLQSFPEAQESFPKAMAQRLNRTDRAGSVLADPDGTDEIDLRPPSPVG